MITNTGPGATTLRDAEGYFWRHVVARTPSTQVSVDAYENGWNALNQWIREDHNWSGHESNVFYVARNGRYYDASGVSGLDVADDSRAFAVTDYDNDGCVDVILKSRRVTTAAVQERMRCSPPLSRHPPWSHAVQP